MKKLVTVLFICFCVSANSQSNSIDSLGNIIKTMQAQIVALQKYDTLLFTPGQLTLIRNTVTKQTVSINNYAAINSTAAIATKASTDVVALTAQLTAALVRITALETSLKALQIKVAGLKATTTIQ